MIYCLGKKEYYDSYIQSDLEAGKKGRGTHDGKPFQGGSVWETEQSAREFILKNNLVGFDVYGVVADWEKDTAESWDGTDCGYRDLLMDSDLQLLV